jgi:hypothetical protein
MIRKAQSQEMKIGEVQRKPNRREKKKRIH